LTIRLLTTLPCRSMLKARLTTPGRRAPAADSAEGVRGALPTIAANSQPPQTRMPGASRVPRQLAVLVPIAAGDSAALRPQRRKACKTPQRIGHPGPRARADRVSTAYAEECLQA
jgi:hypothetical protein